MKKLKSILLIDDDDATNYLHQLLFEEMDLTEHIHISYNGQEALDYILACDLKDLPELILLDINMPLMNGFEFLEEYEKLDKKMKTSIKLLMMLSTSSNPDDANKAKKYDPVNGFLEKPLTQDKITNIWRVHFNT